MISLMCQVDWAMERPRYLVKHYSKLPFGLRYTTIRRLSKAECPPNVCFPSSHQRPD